MRTNLYPRARKVGRISARASTVGSQHSDGLSGGGPSWRRMIAPDEAREQTVSTISADETSPRLQSFELSDHRTM